MVFSLASGNIAGAFEIVTTNDSIGEVFVARPLDREELDHYILKVRTHPLKSLLTTQESAWPFTSCSQLPCCHQVPGSRQHVRAKSMSEAKLERAPEGGGAREPEQDQQRFLSRP